MPRFVRIAAPVLGAFALVCGVLYFVFVRVSLPDPPALSGRFERRTILVGDLDRHYAFYAPSPLPAHPALLVALHGAGQSGEKLRAYTGYAFDRAADAEGFVVAYPDGFGGRWNDCRRSVSFPAHDQHVNDVAFVRAIAGELEGELGVDAARVFAVGHSNGGLMAYRLAVEAGAVVRGVAAISASLPVADDDGCPESGKPVAVLVMNGTADPFNPYEGGVKTYFGIGRHGVVLSSVDTARHFASLDGLTAPPSVERVPGGSDALWVERSTWVSATGPEVILDTVHGGGHAVPQPYVTYPRILGPTDTSFDGPSEIVRFFARLGARHGTANPKR